MNGSSLRIINCQETFLSSCNHSQEINMNTAADNIIQNIFISALASIYQILLTRTQNSLCVLHSTRRSVKTFFKYWIIFHHPVPVFTSLLQTFCLRLCDVSFPVECWEEVEEGDPMEDDNPAADVGEVTVDEDDGQRGVNREDHKLTQLRESYVPDSEIYLNRYVQILCKVFLLFAFASVFSILNIWCLVHLFHHRFFWTVGPIKVRR